MGYNIIIVFFLIVIVLLFVYNNSIENFDDLIWERRFPYMVKARYSYNDGIINKSQFPDLVNYARLGDLPLDLTNIYYASIPFYLLNTNDAYQIDVTNKKYEKPKMPCIKRILPPYISGYFYEFRNKSINNVKTLKN